MIYMTAADTQNKEIVKHFLDMLGRENEKNHEEGDYENDITVSTTYINNDISELQLEIDKINFFPTMIFYKNEKEKEKLFYQNILVKIKKNLLNLLKVIQNILKTNYLKYIVI